MLTSAMTGSVRIKRKVLESGSALAVLATTLLAPQGARAQNECGVPVNGVVTCTAAGNPYPNGITYHPPGDITLTTTPDAKVAGDINVNSAGAVTITNNAAVTVATVPPGEAGIYATGKTVILNSTGPVSVGGVSSVNGVVVQATSGDATVNVGNVAVAPNVLYSSGINVLAGGFGGAIGNENVSFGTVSGGSSGVTVSGDGNIVITGVNASSSAAFGRAVNALSFNGAGSSGDVTVTVSGSVASTGAVSYGITANSYADTTVSVNNVTAGAFGVVAEGANSTVNVTGAIVVSGTSPARNANFARYNGQFIDGVFASGDGELGTAKVVNNGNINAAGDSADAIGAHAIVAIGNGGVTISGTGSASTTGAASDAIVARSSRAISVTQGTVSTTGDNSSGIVARSTIVEPVPARGTVVNDPNNPSPVVNAPGNIAGPVSVTATSVTTRGANASGIIASSDTNAVTVNANSVAVSGAGSKGIVATGAGPVNVTSGAASARDSAVITATSSAGASAVTLNGVTSTGSGPAVAVNGTTMATLVLGSGGTLTAAGGGATLTSTSGSTLINAGTITGNGTTAIVTASGGALAFANSGHFAGLVGFTAGDDRVTNSGTFTALADQDFGAGTNSFTNSGTFAVLTGAGAAATVHLTRLQSFANSGLVDLRNGHAGDVLNIAGSFTGTGGSALGIDITGNTSDKLIAGGAITGSTLLLVTRVSGIAPAAATSGGTVFAVGGAGSSPTAFNITGAQSSGFVRFGIAFDPIAESYALIDGPTDAVFRSVRIGEGAQQLWYKSTDAWSAHMEELRDSRGADGMSGRGSIWGQITGQTDSRSGSQIFDSRSVDLAYRQDAFGGQLGVDLGGAGSPVSFGVTGGYLNSTLSFSNVAERMRYNSINVGAYAGFVSGGLFVNILGKYDHIWLNTVSDAVGYAARFHGNSYGAQGEAGYRFGSTSFYAEPVISIAYVRTNLQDLHALDATFHFDAQDGLRGKAGLRIGDKLTLGHGAVMTVYAQGSYVHEFRGAGGVAFTEGATVISFHDRPIGNYGQGKLGFSVTTPDGVTGFIEGFGDASGGYKGGGGRAGIRLAF